ncbi:MAG: hypothetical protein FWC98_01955 [Bacteroidales bacterium]|nr:hypothetical protein [Bacteroidales bacterium]
MKAVLITYNQALTEAVNAILERHSIRGYTKWKDVQGRGTYTGDPHFGTHTWPAMNSAIFAVVNPERVQPLLKSLEKLDLKAEQQGLRAFAWNIEGIL